MEERKKFVYRVILKFLSSVMRNFNLISTFHCLRSSSAFDDDDQEDADSSPRSHLTELPAKMDEKGKKKKCKRDSDNSTG